MQGTNSILDRLGAGASAICAVHCVLTGVALGLLSSAGLGFLGSRTAELIFLGIALLIGTLAFLHGLRAHRSFVPALFFVTGLALISVGHFVVGHRHDGEANPAPWFNVLGGLCLVLFHVANLRLQHQKRCCHSVHCSHKDA